MSEALIHQHEPHYFEQKSRTLQFELKKVRDTSQKLTEALKFMLHLNQYRHENCQICKQAVKIAEHAILASKGSMR
jgi:hypothetical protein